MLTSNRIAERCGVYLNQFTPITRCLTASCLGPGPSPDGELQPYRPPAPANPFQPLTVRGKGRPIMDFLAAWPLRGPVDSLRVEVMQGVVSVDRDRINVIRLL